MKNISPVSDHTIESVNDGVWSIKVVISGSSFVFEARNSAIRLVSGANFNVPIGIERGRLVREATMKASEKYAVFQNSKVSA